MPRPPDDEDVQLWTQDGVCLAARQVLPSQLRGTLVACHPHPLFGGTMNNKVVHTLYKVFRDQGFGAIRFNFRGTGASGGEHGQGYSEALDVGAAAEALDEAASSRPLANDATEPLPRVLGGFSFGSQVGLRYAADDPTFTHRIGIGLPIGKEGYDFDFLLAGDLRPLYLVVGEDDPFCPSPSSGSW